MATDNGKGIVTVTKGDSLGGIASKFLSTYGKQCGCTKVWGSGGYVEYLGKLNDIKNANVITVGQKLYMTDEAKSGSGGGSSSSTSSATSKNRVTITRVGLVADSASGRELYVQWSFGNEANTHHYEVDWWGGRPVTGGDTFGEKITSEDRTEKWAVYTIPDQYTVANVRVKPVAKTDEKKSGNTTTQVARFVGQWTSMDQTVVPGKENCTRYVFGEYAVIGTPSNITPIIEDFKLTVELTNIPDNVIWVRFQVIKDNNESNGVFRDSGFLNVHSNYVLYETDIEPGGKYKVRAQYKNNIGTGAWSDDSDNLGTKPNAPTGITKCIAKTKTSVYLEWTATDNADSYDIEYTTKKEYFEGSDELQSKTGVETTQFQITGLESGQEYFFRVRAVNEKGESAWTEPVSVIIGTEPAAPTTWSSTITVITGEQLSLYWVHNSEDGSAQTKAEVEVAVTTLKTDSSDISISTSTDASISTKVTSVTNNTNKTSTYIATVTTPAVDEDDEDEERTMYCHINTSGLSEGATIEWRVRTAGATNEYGEWSIKRTVDIYAPPTISINVTDSTATAISTLTQFPFYIRGSAGPVSQKPVGYHFSITSMSYYETVDELGMRKIVNAGQEVYSKYFDTSTYTPLIELSAGNIDLGNNVEYKVSCVVSMDSGLTGEDTRYFTVGWTEVEFEPSASIGVNEDSLTALINPYCTDENGDVIEGVLLSVYRKEFDGSFTEIAKGIKNTSASYVVDPHPALDFARYRIVATSETTGGVNYYDVPGYPVGEKAIVIQWDEAWSSFDTTDDYVPNDPPWSGSMLKLPYNIDVSDDHKPDVSLINYIGREHPVSYYGTQKGHTASWNVEIPKTDKETLYAIRRLANWMGDVYVREPSGTGYWANVAVSYSQKHLDTIIPIKFSVTRVAGGV